MSVPDRKPIKITQPMLPDVNDLTHMIQEIWDSGQLSNNGNMVKQLEAQLASYLKADSLSVFSNGTIALLIACRVLRLSGEVITTPFTFPATVNALAWNHVTPVFCDIEEDSYNIDPDQIESLITKRTTAIMPVHVYGNPCNTEKIQQIADRHGLKVLYDAAHTFGGALRGRPMASFGDISMLSFHATKVYHTLEGGALVYNRPGLKERADELKNFGLQTDGDIEQPGINGKMNEVQAAVGLLLLKKADEEIRRRKELSEAYTERLSGLLGIRINLPGEDMDYNYPYYVISVDQAAFGLSRDALFEYLTERSIYPRKYFYPLCSNLACFRSLDSSDPARLPAANKAADSVLALPLYGALKEEEISYICQTIRLAGKG